MKVLITRVVPQYPNNMFVQWTVEDPTNVILNFQVLRSGSPGGPYETVSPTLTDDVFSHTDDTKHNFGLTTKVWYVVKAVPIAGVPNATLSAPETPRVPENKVKARIARKARYDLGVALKKFNGVDLWVLKKRRFGSRCTSCYNERTKDVVESHCADCYGTSFDKGYHTALKILGKMDPAVVQEGFDRTGKTDMSVHGVTMLDYPEVEIDDILVELHTNRRFIVKRKIPTEGLRNLVHQDLQVSELSRSAVEYLVPVSI